MLAKQSVGDYDMNGGPPVFFYFDNAAHRSRRGEYWVRRIELSNVRVLRRGPQKRVGGRRASLCRNIIEWNTNVDTSEVAEDRCARALIAIERSPGIGAELKATQSEAERYNPKAGAVGDIGRGS